MEQFYIYIYRDPSRNNEPIYVGKGKGKRAYKHLTRSNRHPFVQRLQKMKREGVTPHIEIINAIDEEHALFMERCVIEVIGRKDLGKGTLLNLTDGGEGTSNPSASTRSKMSATRLGRRHTTEAREKMSRTRRQMSDETKAKMSSAQKGHTVSPETRAKLSMACTNPSAESRAKKALTIRNKPPVACPHCDKEGAVSAMKRWPFDNCRTK